MEPADPTKDVVWLFIGGKGIIRSGGHDYEIKEETIARAPVGWPWEIEASQGQSLVALRIRKTLTPEDRAELLKYPENNTAPWVKAFSACTPYSEAIKSAKTVSRTLLPENVVPRMAAGTVETTGPDQVGRHSHPMLEQLFIGLQGNDSTVSADNVTAKFPEYSILHIPLGSMHGTQVAAGR